MFRQTVAGNVLVGSNCALSNRGGLVSNYLKRGNVIFQLNLNPIATAFSQVKPSQLFCTSIKLKILIIQV